MSVIHPSDILAAARLAFTRERQAIDSARCMLIGTSGQTPHAALRPALDGLDTEMRRMLDAEQALTRLVEEVLLRRRGEWPPGTTP